MTETAIWFTPTKAFLKIVDLTDKRLIDLMFYGPFNPLAYTRD
ncbi:hypothetical protein BH10BAC4_BH10BAC4_19730 [soil metagenome]